MKKTPPPAINAEPKLPRFPRPLTAKILKKIRDLESQLQGEACMSGWKAVPTWKEVLDQFRACTTLGITSPNFVRAYGLGCVAAVEALDEAFQDRHAYQDQKWVTAGLLALAESQSQTKKGAKGVESRKESAEHKDKVRREVLVMAVASLSRKKSFNLSIATDSIILEAFGRAWYRYHEEVGVAQNSIPAPPSRNTLKPLIDSVRRRSN